MLEELLDDVVSKHVLHQGGGVGLDFSEDLVLLVAVGRLELLLDEAGPVLIAAEFDDVAMYVLQKKY